MTSISIPKTTSLTISKKKRREWIEWLSGYAFLAPSFIVLAVFTYFPVLYAFVLSFQKWKIMRGDPTFIGLGNYAALLTSEDFWRAIGNTVYFSAGSIPTGMAIALFIAVLLNRPLRALPIYRTVYFLPVITSMVAVSVVWMWIYHPDYGLMNYILESFHLPTIRWLNDPKSAMPALIILGIWKGLGYNVVIYLAGLQNVPEQLYEVARIDGANRWELFRYVTWPLLTPTSFLILILAVINSFQAFTEVQVMTQGGPLGSTTVIVYYLYQQAFQQFNMGYGSAVAMALFVIILALTLVQNRFWDRGSITSNMAKKLENSLIHLTLIAGAIIMVLPFVWMVSTSLKSSNEVFSYPPQWIPSTFIWENYVRAWQGAPFARYFFNSTLVALAVTLGTLITGSLAAYAFARIRFPGRNALFAVYLSSMMIPHQMTIIPSFLVLKDLGDLSPALGLDTYFALIAPFLASAFGVFLLRQSFMTIPNELEDAAILDGCGKLGFLWRIVIPLSRPALATLALFSFMGNWNSYLWPLIVTNSNEMRTVQIGLRYFVGQEGGSQWGLLMAAAVFVSLPIIVVYLFVQKQFVQGIAATGLKQ